MAPGPNHPTASGSLLRPLATSGIEKVRSRFGSLPCLQPGASWALGAALRHPDCGSLWHPQQNRQYGNLPDSDLGIFMASSSPSQSSMSLPSTDVATTRDSCVPLFSGQPNDCRERRKRIALYHKKMVAPKREKEAVCGGGLQPPWLSHRHRPESCGTAGGRPDRGQ